MSLVSCRTVPSQGQYMPSVPCQLHSVKMQAYKKQHLAFFIWVQKTRITVNYMNSSLNFPLMEIQVLYNIIQEYIYINIINVEFKKNKS